MSNNKQIEKKLKLPHRETVISTNTIQTNPFDNQKTTTMSNNKQSSVEFFLYEMFSLLGEFENKALPSYKIMDLFEQAKAMHKEEHGKTWDKSIENFEARGRNEMRAWVDFDEYYNETYESNS